MGFYDRLSQLEWSQLHSALYSKTEKDVEDALQRKGQRTIDDLMALLSPSAVPYLEQMAQLSQQYTFQRFGKTIRMYIPLYLSNSCVNHCVYCGFNSENKIPRIILEEEQVIKEVEAIKKLGDFQHILLVTGEDPKRVGTDYLERMIRLVKPYFSSISLEVQPLNEVDYKRLSEAGLYAVYCYQETYRQETYKNYHPLGIKADYKHRLDAFDNMGRAGVHKIGLGILIGLEDWRTDAIMMAHHLRYLQKHYWRTTYSLSFPRMRPHAGEGFQPLVVMEEKELAQLIFAFRIFDQDVEMALSTRERASFRDKMLSLGVTTVSAGSKTEPGGYAVYEKELEQFSVNDSRDPAEVAKAIQEKGFDVVWKDWDLCLQ